MIPRRLPVRFRRSPPVPVVASVDGDVTRRVVVASAYTADARSRISMVQYLEPLSRPTKAPSMCCCSLPTRLPIPGFLFLAAFRFRFGRLRSPPLTPPFTLISYTPSRHTHACALSAAFSLSVNLSFCLLSFFAFCVWFDDQPRAFRGSLAACSLVYRCVCLC